MRPPGRAATGSNANGAPEFRLGLQTPRTRRERRARNLPAFGRALRPSQYFGRPMDGRSPAAASDPTTKRQRRSPTGFLDQLQSLLRPHPRLEASQTPWEFEGRTPDKAG